MNLNDMTLTAEQIRTHLDTFCPNGHGAHSDGTVYASKTATATEHRVCIAADEMALYLNDLEVERERARWWLMTMYRREDGSRILVHGRDALSA